MIHHPVIVFAYNRPVHLARTLESLAENHGAESTDITVYCDGPRGPQDEPQVYQVRTTAQAAQGFRRVDVRSSSVNRGLATSIIAKNCLTF